MEVDQIKTGGDMKVECKFRSGGDMPTPLSNTVRQRQSSKKSESAQNEIPKFEMGKPKNDNKLLHLIEIRSVGDFLSGEC